MERTRFLRVAAGLLEKLRQDRSVRSALFVFVLTRVVIFIIFVLATHVTVLAPDRMFGRDAQDISISMKKTSIARRLRPLALRGDSGWYLTIARNGYERREFDATGEHNWAFFPLFPLLWSMAAKLTGGFLLTGIALANALFLLALVFLHKTSLAFGGDAAAADRAVFYVAAFPLSYFFSMPFTESLFLLLTVGAFYAAKRGSWWAAGAVGALATATRLTGILLLPALMLLYWQEHRGQRPRTDALGLLLIPVGLLCFMLFLFSITGNALAFKDVLAAWGRHPVFPLLPLIKYLARPLEISVGWDFRFLNFAAAALALTCGVMLARRRKWALAFFTLASMIMPLSTSSLQSQARYAMVIFPLYFVLAQAGRAPQIDQVIRTVFLSLLALMAMMYAAMVTLSFS